MFNPFDLPGMRAMHRSQHMQPIEAVVAAETEMVLKLFREINETYGTVKCQSGHKYPGNESCSVEVTHISLRGCSEHGDPIFGCAHHERSLRERMASGLVNCPECGGDSATCWEIRPA